MEINFEEGHVFAVDKPYGWTSADVVRKLKVFLRWAGHRKIKIGHAGTLDPLATGVLLVCVGRATKRVDELQAQPKEYIARIELGATTPSFDLEHPIDIRYPWEHITCAQVRQALEGFVGPQEQLPPVYSAKKVDGKRAYDYVRHKPHWAAAVELRPASVEFYDVELLECRLPDKPELSVRIRCSRGTYIRAFARDLGVRLGSGAHLTALCRTQSGDYTVENCLSLTDLQEKLPLHQ